MFKLVTYSINNVFVKVKLLIYVSLIRVVWVTKDGTRFNVSYLLWSIKASLNSVLLYFHITRQQDIPQKETIAKKFTVCSKTSKAQICTTVRTSTNALTDFVDQLAALSCSRLPRNEGRSNYLTVGRTYFGCHSYLGNSFSFAKDITYEWNRNTYAIKHENVSHLYIFIYIHLFISTQLNCTMRSQD